MHAPANYAYPPPNYSQQQAYNSFTTTEAKTATANAEALLEQMKNLLSTYTNKAHQVQEVQVAPSPGKTWDMTSSDDNGLNHAEETE